MRACHCGPDPQSHTLPSSRNTLRPYWFDRMRCRGKPGRTRREYMLHFGTPTFYTAFKRLERIANGEMIAHPILETGEVVVAALTCLVGQMQADTHIETDHEKVHVITKTKAGA